MRSAGPRCDPAAEWILVTSSASACSSGARIVGRRRASIVLPTPGGPTIKRWCEPAAATASARRACSSPRTSARSSGSSPSGANAIVGGGIGRLGPRRLALQARVQLAERARDAHVDARDERGLRRVRGGDDDVLDAGARQRVDERDRADDRADAAVETELAEHRDAVEHARRAVRPPRTSTRARRRARGRRRSCGPTAGARFTVTRCCGYSSPDDSSAARTRSRDSRPAASGRPTTV